MHDLDLEKWRDPLRLFLDVVEPIGTLGAQVLWVMQPSLGIFFGHQLIGDLAQVLENPAELEALRKQLDETENAPS
ncbi:MAG UNVERIFIED_CONTAM: hypothetical protein LVT10_19905 [Anaerolineae bacterium]